MTPDGGEGEGPACGMPAAVPALAALAVVLVVAAVALLLA